MAIVVAAPQLNQLQKELKLAEIERKRLANREKQRKKKQIKKK